MIGNPMDDKVRDALELAMEAICGSGDFMFNYHYCEPNNEREMQAYQSALAANEKAFEALLTILRPLRRNNP